jgi:hypothetical protein
MARDDHDRQPARTKTLGVRVTEREWRAVNALARRRDTSVDALLRRWGVRPLLEMAAAEDVDGTSR